MFFLAHGSGADSLPLLALAPLPLIGMALAGVLYVHAVVQLDRRGRIVPLSQRISFVLGLASIFVATQTGLDPLGEHHLVSAHMAQHLLLADIPAPLLLYGLRSPVIVFLWPRAVLVFVAQIGALRSLWAWLRRPATALTIWLATLFLWHVPVAYEAALTTRWVHDAEHLTFMLTGMLVWYPILDPIARRGREFARAGYLACARMLGGILGIVLVVAPTPIYTAYGNESLEYSLTPLQDQQLAGGLMMVVDLIAVTWGVGWLLILAARNADSGPQAANAEGDGAASVSHDAQRPTSGISPS